MVMFGDPHSDHLERWEIMERLAEKKARRTNRGSQLPFWRRPAAVLIALGTLFLGAGVKRVFVPETGVPLTSHLTVQTAGFDGGSFGDAGVFRTRSRDARDDQFSQLVLRPPDAAPWPELDRNRLTEGRALVRSMLDGAFDGKWRYLDRRLRGELDGVASEQGSWSDLRLHWSHSPSGNAAMLRAYHENVRGIDGGMAYHFVIGNGQGTSDGQIEVGERWKSAASSGAGVPEETVSVCLIGNGEPTPAQEAALKELVVYLEAKVGELVPRSVP